MKDNVASLLSLQAKKHPTKKAIVNPVGNHDSYESYTFAELENRINSLCFKLLELGVRPQDKVLIFIRPNLDFSAITFALFRLGAISVFIDPGMPKRMFFKCLQDLAPDVLIGERKVHLLSGFFRKPFRSVRLFINNTDHDGFRSRGLFKNFETSAKRFDTFEPSANDLAAILFTSGGTGPAKGVEYTHDIFINQTKMLEAEFELDSSHTDIAGFPLFSFFTLSMGMTSVIPRIDFSAPAKCRADHVVADILINKASFLAGSPAIWERIANYCLAEKVELTCVKFVVMFGAPVSLDLHQKLAKILPHGTSYTPYGATECLPVSNVSGIDILTNFKNKTLSGAGICVGKPLAGVSVKIISYTDQVLPSLSHIDELADGEIGEIIVSSKNVTQKYYKKEYETKLSKIVSEDAIWHRMGDIGYVKDGVLWFCGRCKHIVHTHNGPLYPVQIEGIVNSINGVKKSAVINFGDQQAAIVIEGDQSSEISKKALDILSAHPSYKSIKNIFFHPKFPVDIRHNIKIDRNKLSAIFLETQ